MGHADSAQVPHLLSLTIVIALSLVPYMLALGPVHALVSVSDFSLHVQILAKPHGGFMSVGHAKSTS